MLSLISLEDRVRQLFGAHRRIVRLATATSGVRRNAGRMTGERPHNARRPQAVGVRVDHLASREEIAVRPAQRVSNEILHAPSSGVARWHSAARILRTTSAMPA